MRRTRTPEERYWEKVDRSGGPDACWPWTASLSWEYGKFTIGKQTRMSHRVGYELQVGPIPEGLVIDHLCRNPLCQNAKRLEPVTNRENLLRGSGTTAINAAKTHCPKGHPCDVEAAYGRRHRRCTQCTRDRDARRAQQRLSDRGRAPAAPGDGALPNDARPLKETTCVHCGDVLVEGPSSTGWQHRDKVAGHWPDPIPAPPDAGGEQA